MADFIPTRESELVSWLTAFKSALNPPTAFGISAVQKADVDAFVDNFIEAYNACQLGTTRSPAKIQAKNAAKTTCVDFVRSMVRIIQSYPGMTDEMRAALGITVPSDTRAPVPPPAESPKVDIVAVSNNTVTVRVHRSDDTRRGKPRGAAYASVYGAVTNAQPNADTVWIPMATTSRSEVEVAFASDVAAGATVYLCAYWVSARQESGPASNPVSTRLQGVMSVNSGSMKYAQAA